MCVSMRLRCRRHNDDRPPDPAARGDAQNIAVKVMSLQVDEREQVSEGLSGLA